MCNNCFRICFPRAVIAPGTFDFFSHPCQEICFYYWWMIYHNFEILSLVFCCSNNLSSSFGYDWNLLWQIFIKSFVTNSIHLGRWWKDFFNQLVCELPWKLLFYGKLSNETHIPSVHRCRWCRSSWWYSDCDVGINKAILWKIR